ncbi:neurogenic differentiation factor 4-like [Branchiostoma lanceolatum]|uniref:neurogenic differentiation factor 4-like n=1 Tax=Branchiostoma lanceolatum TaxID=7740 RepID=UPI00345684B2
MPSYDFNYTFPGFSDATEGVKSETQSSSDEAGMEENATQQHHRTHVQQAKKNGGGKVSRRKRPSRKKDPTNPESLVRRLVANSQERDRMHGINDALERLRRHIPLHLGSRRLSKIKTLRMAMAYIEALTDMVHHGGSSPSSSTLSYPDSEDSFQDKPVVKSEVPEQQLQEAGKSGGQRFSGRDAMPLSFNFFGKSKERGKGRMGGHTNKRAGRRGAEVTRASGYTTG